MFLVGLTDLDTQLRTSASAQVSRRNRTTIREDMVMPDDTVTTSWKRSTDKVKTPGGASVHRSLTETSRTLRQESHSNHLGLGSTAASSSAPTRAEAAAAGCPTDRKGEAIRQAATLATWEDEGGTTVFVD